MKSLFLSVPILMAFGITSSMASQAALDDALRATYTACVGIDDELADLKKMAGITTAVGAVGAGVGIGATVTGIVKSAKDKKAESLEQILKEIEEISQPSAPLTDEQVNAFLLDFNNAYETALSGKSEIESELEKTVKQSKKLGNWRTGLMATNTATNVAGAIMAGKNKVDADLTAQIESCKAAIVNLRNAVMQARMNGIDVTEATEIANTCGEYEYVDLSKINAKAKGAMISSTIGAATGATGTALSAAANSNKVRDDNTDDGKKKEKSMNTASTVLAGVTAAASVSSTVFSGTQIKAIKQVASVAEKCTGVLK